MNPLYFGTSQRPLFGVYHPPRARSVRATGIVLCYPMGQEYMRAHRAFRQLANLLSKAGFHVLRFDYSCTGDSGGDGDAADVRRWVDDLGNAIDELKDTAGVTRVSVVGLRIGGAIAALGRAARKDLDQIVLWDPIVDGAAYVQSLLEASGPSARETADRGGTIGVQGFPLSAGLRAGLEAIDLRTLSESGSARIAVVVSEDRPEYGALRDRLGERRIPVAYRCFPSAGNWGEIDRWGSALLPQAIIQGIVATLSDGAAS